MFCFLFQLYIVSIHDKQRVLLLHLLVCQCQNQTGWIRLSVYFHSIRAQITLDFVNSSKSHFTGLTNVLIFVNLLSCLIVKKITLVIVIGGIIYEPNHIPDC